MGLNSFILSSEAASRLRSCVLLLGFVVFFVVWDIGLDWRWYQQSLAILGVILVLYSILSAIRKFGRLPSAFPELLSAILRSTPRPLISPLSIVLLIVATALLFSCFCLLPASDGLGYTLTVYPLSSPTTPIYQTNLEVPNLLPFDLPCLLDDPSPSRICLSSYLFFPDSTSYKPSLYTNSGETQLLVDGHDVGQIPQDPSNRVTIPIVDLSSGWHYIEIHHRTISTPPSIDLKWFVSDGSEYVPFHPRAARTVQDCVHPWRVRSVQTTAIAGLTIAIILLLSVGISWVTWHVESIQPIPKFAVTFIILLTCLVGIALGRWALLVHTGGMIEADEAAFGLMAQRLLRGELPPIFHYGQTYQGIAEVIPLAALFKEFGSSPFVLKLEPLLCFSVFSILLLILYRKICSLTEIILLLAILIFSPFLLMWISLKAWFGYAETLCSSGVILLSTYKLVYRSGSYDRYWAVLLGVASGVSLYILPFSIPVVLSAMLFLLWCKRINRWRMLLLAAGVTLAVAIPPYILHDLSSEEKSGSFLLRGRQLGAPRVAGERPFMDRFLNECFPVIMGGRTIYDDQRDIPAGDLPRVLYLITTLGFVLLIWDLRDDFREFIRGEPPGRFLFVLPALLSIPIGVLSPFGIWPWYFLPIYIGLPLVWASFLKFTFRYAYPVGLAAIAICLIVWIAGSATRSELMFQPSSLVKTGVTLRQDNTPIIQALLDHGVSHVICDQGADFATQSTGRDWMGERLTFESGLRINAIHPLTRRHPHLFADTVAADRVAYLFRNSYQFMDFNHLRDPGYQPVTFESLSGLFGPHFLNYTRLDLDNEVLFIPEPDHPSNGKGGWKVTSNREQNLVQRLHDHSISSRAYGPTYWTSGAPQTPGDYIEIDTGRIMPMQGIVMYHGVKTLDRPRSAMVLVSQDKETWWEMGPTGWEPLVSATYWKDVKKSYVRYIRVELRESPEPSGDYWWTIYELWII
ncbi:MAG: discoidin domain-containing protein [bacterium]